MTTFTGKLLDFDDLRPEMICVEDIAHSLARICRYNGHVDAFYSVAQHSVLAARYAPFGFKFKALMHDAAEAYVGDLTRKLKYSDELTGFRLIEQRVEQLLARRFKLSTSMSSTVKLVDNRLAVTEKRDLFTHWDNVEWPHQAGVEPYAELIVPWTWSDAEDEFLRQFYRWGG